MAAVDECFGDVDLASLVKVARERCEYSIEHAFAFPFLEAPKARRVRRISRRHVSPWSTCAKDPKNAVKDVTRIAPRSAALRTRALPLRSRNEALNRFPLLVLEVHRRRYKHLFRRMEIGSRNLKRSRSLASATSYEMRSSVVSATFNADTARCTTSRKSTSARSPVASPFALAHGPESITRIASHVPVATFS